MLYDRQPRNHHCRDGKEILKELFYWWHLRMVSLDKPKPKEKDKTNDTYTSLRISY